MTDALARRILSRMRDVEDFPQPGVTFKDLTPVLADGELLAEVVAAHADPWAGQVDLVAGLEARGFILGAAVATRLGVGFLPVRKAGKLPGPTVGVDYELEYGGGFNWSSQHLDHGGVQGWRRATGVGRPAMYRRGFVGSGVRIGRCARRCVRLDDPSLRGRCSDSSGG